MPDMIFMAGDNKIINGEHIIEVDFRSKKQFGVWISFVDGSTREYNVSCTNIIKSYCKEHEIEYKNLKSMSGMKPKWEEEKDKSNA